jgi:hypothetical protein
MTGFVEEVAGVEEFGLIHDEDAATDRDAGEEGWRLERGVRDWEADVLEEGDNFVLGRGHRLEAGARGWRVWIKTGGRV